MQRFGRGLGTHMRKSSSLPVADASSALAFVALSAGRMSSVARAAETMSSAETATETKSMANQEDRYRLATRRGERTQPSEVWYMTKNWMTMSMAKTASTHRFM